jgi:uncharacterized coiled-coil protein SlyX
MVMAAWMLALPTGLLCAQVRAQVTLPHTFQPNTPAKAGEVNDDFAALKAAIDALQTTVAAQQQTIASLQGTVTAQASTITSLQSTVSGQATTITSLQGVLAAVQNNTVLQLDGMLGLVTDPATNQPTARFTAVNVQIRQWHGADGNSQWTWQPYRRLQRG